MPRKGPLLKFEAERETGEDGTEVLILSFRERGTGRGSTLRIETRGACALARLLDGTRIARSSDAPAEVHIVGEVLHHV